MGSYSSGVVVCDPGDEGFFAASSRESGEEDPISCEDFSLFFCFSPLSRIRRFVSWYTPLSFRSSDPFVH